MDCDAMVHGSACWPARWRTTKMKTLCILEYLKWFSWSNSRLRPSHLAMGPLCCMFSICEHGQHIPVPQISNERSSSSSIRCMPYQHWAAEHTLNRSLKGMDCVTCEKESCFDDSMLMVVQRVDSLERQWTGTRAQSSNTFFECGFSTGEVRYARAARNVADIYSGA